MSNFKIGDEVVCIESGYTTCKTECVVYGETYVIAECDDRCRIPVVYLVGLKAVWCADRFRKVEPSKQKTSYRMATLEILTQFPTVKETSDQPFNIPTEKGVEA